MRMMMAIALGFLVGLVYPASAGLSVSRVGVYGGFPVGGDIGDGEGAFGAQVEMPVRGDFSGELSVSWSQEESDDRLYAGIIIEQELITIGLSGVYRREIRGTELFLVAGVSFNIAEADTAIDVLDIEMDPGLGIHAAVGVDLFTYKEKWELFVEYRYTYLTLDGEWTAGTIQTDEERDNSFGLAKLGINYLF